MKNSRMPQNMAKGRRMPAENSKNSAMKKSNNTSVRNTSKPDVKRSTAVEQKNPSKAAGSDTVTLTQSEFDAILGAIGKLSMEKEKLSSAAKTTGGPAAGGVDRQRLTRIEEESDHSSRLPPDHHYLPQNGAPPPPQQLSLVERKRLEWNRDAGDHGPLWAPWSDHSQAQSHGSHPQYASNTSQHPYSQHTNVGGGHIASNSVAAASLVPVTLTPAEKKKLKWQQERAEQKQLEGYSPWGRGGSGAPIRDHYGNLLNDYSNRRHGLSDFTAGQQHLEDSIYPPQGQPVAASQPMSGAPDAQLVPGNPGVPSQMVPGLNSLNQQHELTTSREVPPAAIRSSFAVGAAVPDENRFDSQKSVQKQQWLEELERQRAEQRQRRDDERRRWKEDADQPPPPAAASAAMMSSQHWADRTEFQPPAQPSDVLAANDGPQTFLRGQNVPVDPTTKREMEDKRQKYIEHQEFLRHQIAERDRQKREEKERRLREDLELERHFQQQQQRGGQMMAAQHQLPQQGPTNSQPAPAPPQSKPAPSTWSALPVSATQPPGLAQQPPAPTSRHVVRNNDQVIEALEAARRRAEREKHERWLQKLEAGNHDTSRLRANFESKYLEQRHEPVESAANDVQYSPRQLPTAVASSPRGGYVHVEPDYIPGLTAAETVGRPAVDDDEGNRTITSTVYRRNADTAGMFGRKEFGTQTEVQLADLLDRDSPVEVEYRPPRHADPQSKKVRVVSAAKLQPRKPAVPDAPPTQAVGGNRKPAWNARRKTVAGGPVTHSERDPRFRQRQDRRLERQRELLAQVAANEKLVPRQRFVSRQPHDDFDESPLEPTRPARRRQSSPDASPAVRGRSPRRKSPARTEPGNSPDRSPPRQRSVERAAGRRLPRSRSGSVGDSGDFIAAGHLQASPPVPAVKHRIDTDRSDRGPAATHRYRDSEEASARVPDSGDFIPFLRTSEVLDPAHAESPLPVSREPTDMVKARRAYQRELNPAKYGQFMDHRGNPQNNAGVSDRPSSQQGRLLQNLSTLRQMLSEKEREITSDAIPQSSVLAGSGGSRLVSPVGYH